MDKKEKHKQIKQDLALLDEIKTSSKLIRLGLGEIQNLDSGNDFYFLPFQLLSQGFERLMKSIICLGYFNENNEYPPPKFIKSQGHDLEKLLEVILSNYLLADASQLLKEDKLFLSSDSDLKQLLHILSEFGKFSRYYNFDVITDSTKPAINSEALWAKYESDIMLSENIDFKQLVDPENAQQVYHKIARHIVIAFEKYIAALSRQFTHKALGDKGVQFFYEFMDFAVLSDSKYGTTDYRTTTTRYIHKSHKKHKRNIIDFLKRKFNSKIRHKKINRSDYDGEWPFYADEVIIECRDKYWCVVSISGYDYALNGSAAGYYQLELAHDAGVAIIGISTSDFIKMALELGKDMS